MVYFYFLNLLKHMPYYSINKEEWDKTIAQLLLSHTIIAPVNNGVSLDYEVIRPADIDSISYNQPKPVTPLKNFFLPVKENVTVKSGSAGPRIIIGIPNCDIAGLGILDEIYLDKDYVDIFYRERREKTILISADCFGIQEHCHCISYGIKPYDTANGDLAVIRIDGQIIIRVISARGKEFLKNFPSAMPLTDDNLRGIIDKEHINTEAQLDEANRGLPDYASTGMLIKEVNNEIWEKYSSRCVSCGACTTICPACSCFLLIDKPGFEKIRQMDACQYPGFERVAGGEDGLFELHHRFRNRYMCKYVWKPERFSSPACTGCGRCIEACIGKINKNELLLEISRQ
jgi:ferredoxin